MSNKVKKAVTGGVLALATAAAVSTLAPGAAQAAAPAASYNGACGSGYSEIDHHNITGATIFLTYSSSTGKNCVVTVRNSPGAPMTMYAEISLAGHAWIIDIDQYTTYAGPVSVAAAHQCIDWGGGLNGYSWSDYDTHCG
jgi:hypothetical protein